MKNVAVATTLTEVVAADTVQSGLLTIQNQSDTNIYYAIGAANIANLTAALGLILEPGDTAVLTGPQASQRIAAIHGGSGSKTLHIQVIK